MASDRVGRTIESGRLGAFSDAVFAIALTLLVLDLKPPPIGHFAVDLLRQWPTYLAYLAAFVTIGGLWAGHHDAFSRVRRVGATATVLNLALLLGAALVPWPASLISTALRGGRLSDETAAILVYSLVLILIGVPYAMLDLHLAAHPSLLVSATDARWLRQNALRAFGTIGVAVLGGALAFAVPLASLVLFLLVPLAFTAAAVIRDRRPGPEGDTSG